MHELPVMNSILRVVMKHAALNRVTKVAAIELKVGKLSDLEEKWMQHYFDFLTKGTLAEGAKLEIEWGDVVMRCSGCAREFSTEPAHDTFGVCPHCGNKGGEILSGKEYYVKNMVAQ
ncbi:hydrogenase maturation nickel metallochaperone HypA [Desulfoluna butyratoxydans]|uniref:Hydrogenase maturation factor HypA n=1 Tax=Desulfoluna butyratoxydans TaxID=231438 RepID=A0A4U8YJ40_9BACT|nr:hydrogenase maturation nickel metallochaperone HypA [Desulfoluna butyratoxydans]VFQ43726.1 hydrogenase/urease nickel incorporation metallochaperone hypa [Desulfoluna butyratoxydans]